MSREYRDKAEVYFTCDLCGKELPYATTENTMATGLICWGETWKVKLTNKGVITRFKNFITNLNINERYMFHPKCVNDLLVKTVKEELNKKGK
jgi:hypothetical protein